MKDVCLQHRQQQQYIFQDFCSKSRLACRLVTPLQPENTKFKQGPYNLPVFSLPHYRSLSLSIYPTFLTFIQEPVLCHIKYVGTGTSPTELGRTRGNLTPLNCQNVVSTPRGKHFWYLSVSQKLYYAVTLSLVTTLKNCHKPSSASHLSGRQLRKVNLI